MVTKLNQLRLLSQFLLMAFIVMSDSVLVFPYICYMIILTYTNFFPLDSTYQQKYKQIFQMWERLNIWLKTTSFLVSFIHILFHFPNLLDSLPPGLVESFGNIYLNNVFGFLRLVTVIVMFMVNCYQSNIHTVYTKLFNDFKEEDFLILNKVYSHVSDHPRSSCLTKIRKIHFSRG